MGKKRPAEALEQDADGVPIRWTERGQALFPRRIGDDMHSIEASVEVEAEDFFDLRRVRVEEGGELQLARIKYSTVEARPHLQSGNRVVAWVAEVRATLEVGAVAYQEEGEEED